MKTMMRAFWLAALVIFLSGCTTMRTVNLPGEYPAPEDEGKSDRVVAIGDRVTILLRDGSEISGEVTQMSEVLVSLESARRENFHQNEVGDVSEVHESRIEIPRDQILTISKRMGDPLKTALLLGVCVAAMATYEEPEGDGKIDWGGSTSGWGF